MKELPTLEVSARRSASVQEVDPENSFPDETEWRLVPPTPLILWSGAPDPLALTPATGPGPRPRHEPATFRLLRDARALHLRAELPVDEPNLAPALAAEKAEGLWDHDVVELFVSPFSSALPYFELEASPLGQSLDYRIDEPRRRVDRAWRSGVSVRGHVLPGHHVIELSLPWAGLPAPPPTRGRGTPWRANVYAALGPAGPSRRFLAWSPTLTPEPDFHVPARFGYLVW